MQMDGSEISPKKEELRRAVSDLRDRGLYTAAKFAAELLSGKPASPETVDVMSHTLTSLVSRSIRDLEVSSAQPCKGLEA